jgi:hypothetical protein
MKRDSSKTTFPVGKLTSITVEPAFPVEADSVRSTQGKRPVVKPAAARVRDSLVLRVVVKNPAAERNSDHERTAR